MKVDQARIALQTAVLYGILDTGYSSPSRWPELGEKLIDGGVQILQIRAKNSGPAEIIKWSLALRPILASRSVPLIINDHPELVSACQADGCHIGQDDMSVNEAKNRAGIDCLIGKSSHSVSQALSASSEKPDYLGFGPLFPTPTKPTYQAIGLNVIREVDPLLRLPYFCIGGIKLENLSQVLAAGAKRVVLVSGLLTAEDPQAYARSVRQELLRFC